MSPLARSLAAFLIGLGLAYSLSWTVTDLVWSLWLSSLVIGYASIVSIILGYGILIRKGFDAQEEKQHPKGMWVVIFGIGAFFLGFFTLHFCAFHAGHATFLASFFPTTNLEPNAFSGAFMNPPRLWTVALTQVLPSFGWFLIPVLLLEWPNVIDPVKTAFSVQLDGENAAANIRKVLEPKRDKTTKKVKDPFFGPYVNVIRMHLLIFALGALNALGMAESFVTYALVSLVYFFPWRTLKATLNASKEGPAPESL